MASLIPQYELSMMQRVLLIYAFIFCGMTIGFRAAQQYTERPYPWTQLNDRTRPYWYTFFVLEAFLLSQITHRVFSFNAAEAGLGPWAQALLDGVWNALFVLEAAMLLFVAALTVVRAVRAQGKVKEKEL